MWKKSPNPRNEILRLTKTVMQKSCFLEGIWFEHNFETN